MPFGPHILNVAHVIQLAVAPVFLLSGVGVMLTVFTSRLARIVDRSRVLEERLEGAEPHGSAVDAHGLGNLRPGDARLRRRLHAVPRRSADRHGASLGIARELAPQGSADAARARSRN